MESLLEELRTLSFQMNKCAKLLDAYGYVWHGNELSGAEGLVKTWHDGILKENFK